MSPDCDCSLTSSHFICCPSKDLQWSQADEASGKLQRAVQPMVDLASRSFAPLKDWFHEQAAHESVSGQLVPWQKLASRMRNQLGHEQHSWPGHFAEGLGAMSVVQYCIFSLAMSMSYCCLKLCPVSNCGVMVQSSIAFAFCSRTVCFSPDNPTGHKSKNARIHVPRRSRTARNQAFQ